MQLESESVTLYSDEIQQIVRSYDWPKNLVVEIIEYEDYLGFRLFRDNFETFDGVEKEQIAKMVGAAIFAVRQKGCPCYMEVVKGDGKRVRGS